MLYKIRFLFLKFGNYIIYMFLYTFLLYDFNTYVYEHKTGIISWRVGPV